jgi:predicted nucleotidyltransferase
VRLSDSEKKVILTAVRRFDPRARIFLFGSRTDDAKRGGDIDLLVISDSIGLVSMDETDTPLVKLARRSGVPLQ